MTRAFFSIIQDILHLFTSNRYVQGMVQCLNSPALVLWALPKLVMGTWLNIQC